MGSRGPRSKAELAVVPAPARPCKPAVPASLPPDAADTYRELLTRATEPPAPADGPLIEALAVAITRMRGLQAKVLEGDVDAHRQFIDLSRLAASLAVKVRLASSAHRRPSSSRPAGASGPVDVSVILGKRHAAD